MTWLLSNSFFTSFLSDRFRPWLPDAFGGGDTGGDDDDGAAGGGAGAGAATDTDTGDDALVGKNGLDTLTGGAGADRFTTFENPLDPNPGVREVIGGEDTTTDETGAAAVAGLKDFTADNVAFRSEQPSLAAPETQREVIPAEDGAETFRFAGDFVQPGAAIPTPVSSSATTAPRTW